MALNVINPATYAASMGAVSVTHKFEFNYSKTMERHIGRSIDSSVLSLAGRTYKIQFYPQGTVDIPNSMSVFLAVVCPSAETVSFGYIFLNKAGMPTSKASAKTTFVMSSPHEKFGLTSMMEKPDLEADFVKDGSFTLLFTLTFLGNSHNKPPTEAAIGIIPFSISEQFAELLGDKEMTDVVFEVGGETFTAHRLVLAARSPYFKALLFGGMAEKDKESIQIKDVTAPIFKAMLHFIYSDSLPDISNEELPTVTLIQDLYKAADMYVVEGLKVVCEGALVREVSMDTVVSSLALADKLDCSRLKDACLRFVSNTENLLQLAMKADYVDLMSDNPTLREELVKYAGGSSVIRNLVCKKRRVS